MIRFDHIRPYLITSINTQRMIPYSFIKMGVFNTWIWEVKPVSICDGFMTDISPCQVVAL